MTKIAPVYDPAKKPVTLMGQVNARNAARNMPAERPDAALPDGTARYLAFLSIIGLTAPHFGPRRLSGHSRSPP